MIKLCEPFRGVLYTPFYLVHELGAYEAEGLEVSLETARSPAEAAPSGGFHGWGSGHGFERARAAGIWRIRAWRTFNECQTAMHRSGQSAIFPRVPLFFSKHRKADPQSDS